MYNYKYVIFCHMLCKIVNEMKIFYRMLRKIVNDKIIFRLFIFSFPVNFTSVKSMFNFVVFEI